MKKLDSESLFVIMVGLFLITVVICMTILAINGIIKP